MMMIYLQMIETPEEQSKFEVLYDQYRGLMYTVAYRILEHEQDAEDAVHQAFVKVAENMKNIDEPVCGRTKSYLVTIVENKTIDIYRARARRNEVAYDETTVGIEVEYTGSFELAGCFAKLPARYREVLVMKYVHGLPNKEIGRLFDLKEASVRQLEKRARDKLAEICREEGVEV